MCDIATSIRFLVSLFVYLFVCLEVRSIVPMVHMIWNLVQSVKIVDETLYKELRYIEYHYTPPLLHGPDPLPCWFPYKRGFDFVN